MDISKKTNKQKQKTTTGFGGHSMQPNIIILNTDLIVEEELNCVTKLRLDIIYYIL